MGHARRANLFVVIAALGIGGGWAAAWLWPNAPLLAWWLACAVAFGIYLSFSGGSVGLPARAAQIVLLHGVLIPSSLLTTQLAARRQVSSTHLRYRGVHVETDSVTIGAGLQGADVLFPFAPEQETPWRLTVVRRAGAWFLVPPDEVEHARVSPDASAPQPSLTRRVASLVRLRESSSSAVLGALLADTASRAVVHDARGRPLETFALAWRDGAVVLRSQTMGDFLLAPANPRLAARYQRLLRAGTSLAALDRAGPRANLVDLPLDRFVRVQELSRRQDVNGNWPGLLAPLVERAGDRRFLLSAVSPLVARDAMAETTRGMRLADSTRVEVRHGGGTWRFDLVSTRRERSAAPGLSIRFVRNPRPLDAPLPSGTSCVDGEACGLLSLRQLSAPAAYVWLGSAGLDTTRFALLASLRPAADGFDVAVDRQVLHVQGAAATYVPATRAHITPNGSREAASANPTHFVILAAAENQLEGLTRIAIVAGALTVLLLVVWQLVRMSGGMVARNRSVSEHGLALALSAFLALLVARLTVGARVTFFPPYNEAGLETAIGMTVAITVVALGLLLWSRWVPPLLVGLHDRSNLAWTRVRAWRPFANVRSRARRGSLIRWYAAAVITLGLLVIASRSATLNGLLVGALVLGTWFLLAWVSAFAGSTFHRFDGGPCEVIEHAVDVERSLTDGRLLSAADRQLALVPLQWTIALWMPPLGVAIAVVRWVVSVVRRAEPGSRPGLAQFGVMVSVAAIAALKWMSENGAMAAFLLVVLVALVSVRIGRSLAAHLALASRAGVAAIPWWQVTLLLAAPLLLLLPLAALDMGLLLVMAIPIGAAALLAVGWTALARAGRIAVSLLIIAVVWFMGSRVLFPSIGVIGSRDATYVDQATAFERMQGVLGFRVPIGPINRSLERAAARAVATVDQAAAERLLVAARPGEARDLLIPSIEQTWGTRAYAAAGLLGRGLGRAPVGRGGIAEAVSYAENSYAVYVLQEHGAVGGVALLLAYACFVVAILLALRRQADTVGLRASRALFLVAALLIAIPAAYVALSNLGVVPITGQNMPFLGLNAWSDVALCAGAVGMLLAGGMRTQTMHPPTT
ncbi:MAG: hypothetical protein IT361_04415 [Gemmatimonadaceae bacterium]|nr:hypothetical protein [Gemmatimonadaceae bacterium]